MTIEQAQRMSLADKLAARKMTIDYLAGQVGIAESIMDNAVTDDEWLAASHAFVKAKQALRESAYGLKWVPYHALAVAAQ